MPGILIVDDDEIFSTTFSAYMERLGHRCMSAGSLHEGLQAAEAGDFDIVFLDIVLPDMNGLEGIGPLRSAASSPEVIIITGRGDFKAVEIALKSGAWDYLEKPPSFNRIRLLIDRALQHRENRRQWGEHKILRRDFIIGNSTKLKECLEIVAKSAGSDGSVLVTGETGTGKELIARAVHLNSRRAQHNFVTIDCTNIPSGLAESIFFGSMKGSYTGADRNRQGLIKQAEEGTLFLDEVGDLPETVQKSLLRVLQDKRFRPVGAEHEESCDFRTVCASNRNIGEMAELGYFRKDLYYRLAAFHVHLPPLRERKDDIRLLTNHYVDQICQESGTDTKGMCKDFMKGLLSYDWPGNVRELTNVLRMAIANAVNEPVLHSQHLPMNIRLHYYKDHIRDKNEPQEARCDLLEDMESPDGADFPRYRDFRETAERRYLDGLIELADGKARRACTISGISRARLYQLLKKHGKRLR